MNTIRFIIQILVAASGCLVAFLSILLSLRLRWPAPVLWILKLHVSALSPLLVLIGFISIIVGQVTGSVFLSFIGMYDVLFLSIHIYRVTRTPDSSSSFEKAFGIDWEKRINREQKHQFLSKRTTLRLPGVSTPRMEQNISFSTIPDTERKLLCDVWQPPENVIPSGLAFIYLHGGAWCLLDKDLGTRPFFNHLAAQGHVIMDVAYRLAPETDMMGMVNDVQRAIVWMKENAGTYKVNPNRIVVGGGSSGAHLALLAAYTAKNPKFAANELEGKDTSVCAVISLYGPTNLEPMYYHTNQHLTTRSTSGKPKKTAPAQIPEWIRKKMGKEYYRLGFEKDLLLAGTFAPLLGGHPDECPENYAFYSPISYVHSDCPPTLLIHGDHDLMAPVKTVQSMHMRLLEEKVQTVMHIIPQTDHAFDLILPKISPSAHNAFYDVERFLAILVGKKQIVDNKIRFTAPPDLYMVKEQN